MPQKHVLICSMGSLGDLFPFLTIALELQKRGVRVTFASQPGHRARIEPHGIRFLPLAPDLREDDKEMVRKATDRWTGADYMFKTLVAPYVAQNARSLLDAISDVDLLVSGSLAYSAPLVAEKSGVKWLSAILAPLSLFSLEDPPVFAPLPWARDLQTRFPSLNRFLFAQVERHTRKLVRPIALARRELGLSAGRNPILWDTFSSEGTLALFSPLLAAPKKDWPSKTDVTGFVFRDTSAEQISPEQLSFLEEESSKPLVVFALGSAVVQTGEKFFAEARKAIEPLDVRAVFASGFERRAGKVLETHFVPYSRVFPRAAMVVHQCGIGTTADALRAGVPQLCVPFSHDQFDNAYRMEKLGVARQLYSTSFSARKARLLIEEILTSMAMRARAAALGDHVRRENGLERAVQAILARLA